MTSLNFFGTAPSNLTLLFFIFLYFYYVCIILRYVLKLLWNGFITLLSEYDEEIRPILTELDKDDEDCEAIIRELKKELEEPLSQMGNISFKNCQFGENKSSYSLLSLFNKNENALNWFFNYIKSNISDWSTTINSYDDADDIDDPDWGIRYYLCHYLTIGLYSLFVTNDSCGNALLEEGKRKYKTDLSNFFQFIRQFSIYNACYPRSRKHEQFSMKLFTRC